MSNRIWSSVTDSLERGEVLDILAPSPKSQPFKIVEIKPGLLRIKFLESGSYLKLERKRFISAYKMLEENMEHWVDIGATRTNTKLGTLEGRIKQDYNDDMNGLSTATWIAKILVKVFENIEFNGKKKGQALRMK